jgi:hypothetical protein
MLPAVVVAFIAIGGAVAEPRLFDLALKDGRLPENQRLVRVRQGDEVTLKWTTDKPFTLHLHGYDLEARLVPQTPIEPLHRPRDRALPARDSRARHRAHGRPSRGPSPLTSSPTGLR